MTEAEWLHGSDPYRIDDLYRMLEAVTPTGSGRKLRLFACACCRSIPDYLDSEPDRLGLELTERDVDEGVAADAFDAVDQEAWDMRWYRRDPGNAVDRAISLCWEWVWNAHHLWEVGEEEQATIQGERIAELAGLLRDIFGNPFRPVVCERSWLTPAVEALAKAAYEERLLPAGNLAPVRLGILADALEDAGCTETSVPDHLRGPGAHIRGCWVVDLILGKR